ncbi:hypothetical protein ACQV2B_20840 [Pantoea allii]|uniref:hypothetical protein n=1 Tax=Pantoea allii TaxID=574096 RepID=UPI003D311645
MLNESEVEPESAFTAAQPFESADAAGDMHISATAEATPANWRLKEAVNPIFHPEKVKQP